MNAKVVSLSSFPIKADAMDRAKNVLEQKLKVLEKAKVEAEESRKSFESLAVDFSSDLKTIAKTLNLKFGFTVKSGFDSFTTKIGKLVKYLNDSEGIKIYAVQSDHYCKDFSNRDCITHKNLKEIKAILKQHYAEAIKNKDINENKHYTGYLSRDKIFITIESFDTPIVMITWDVKKHKSHYCEEVGYWYEKKDLEALVNHMKSVGIRKIYEGLENIYKKFDPSEIQVEKIDPSKVGDW